jgi:hypothetical protein
MANIAPDGWTLAVRAKTTEETLSEHQQVISPVSQRRHLKNEHVDPVVEILAESSVNDRLLEIDMRGRKQPEINRDRCACTQPGDEPVL